MSGTEQSEVHGTRIVWGDYFKGPGPVDMEAVPALDPRAFAEGFCPNDHAPLGAFHGTAPHWCPECHTYWSMTSSTTYHTPQSPPAALPGATTSPDTTPDPHQDMDNPHQDAG